MQFSIISSLAMLLAAVSAQDYSFEPREAGFKSTVSSAWNSVKNGAKSDAQAYKQGFSTGYNKRDLELRDAKNYFNSLMKFDAKAMGTVQGAAAKAFVGARDLQGLYIREPGWKQTAGAAATAVEKGLGTVAGTLGRTLVGGAVEKKMGGKARRDLYEEDIFGEDLYIRDLLEDDDSIYEW